MMMMFFCPPNIRESESTQWTRQRRTSDQLSTDQAGGQGARLQRLVRGGAVDALHRSSGTTITSSNKDDVGGGSVSESLTAADDDDGTSSTHWT